MDDGLVVRFSTLGVGETVADAAAVRAEVAALGKTIEKTDAIAKTSATGGMAKVEKATAAVAASTTTGTKALADHEQAYQRLNKAIQGVHGKLTSFLSGAGSRLISWAKNGAYALGLLAAGAGALGFKLAMANEQFLVGATRMLGSSTAAKALLADLRKFSEKTPFQMSNLRPLAAQLLGQGFKGNQIVPTLTGLGDVVSGTGGGQSELDRVVANLGQIEAAKKISGRELRDFAMNKIPALAQIAQALNMTTAQVQAMTATAGGGADLYKRVGGAAGLAQILGGGKFKGGMADQSKTMGGILSNIRDSFENGMADAVGKTFGVLKPKMEGLMTSMGPFMARFGDQFGSALLNVINVLERNWPTIKMVAGVFRDLGAAVIADIIPAFKGLQPILVIAGAVLLIVAKATTGLLKVLKPVLPVLIPLIAAIWLLNAALAANPFVAIAMAIGIVAIGLVTLYQRSERFRNIVDAIGRVTLGPLKSALGGVAGVIRAMVSDLRDAVAFMHELNNPGKAIKKHGAGLGRWLAWANPMTAPYMIGRSIRGAIGDTTRPRALAGTMAMASMLAPAGGAFAVTSGIRGDNLGHANSGHLDGRAIDVTGSHLGGLVSAWNGAGGFGEIHGAGASRHAHLERPFGDTTYARGGSTGGGINLVVNVDARGSMYSLAQIEAAGERGARRVLVEYERAKRERQ